MNQVVFGKVGRRWKTAVFQSLWLIVLAVLVACGGGGETTVTLGTDVQAPLAGQAVLTCSAQCAARGQCGTAPDGQTVVLGGVAGPTLQPHDRLFPNNTTVMIGLSEIRTLQLVSDPNQQAQVPFYAVATTDQSRTGWVAGWCVAASPAPAQ